MPSRRIAPVPVNNRAKTSMAFYKIMKEQQNLLKKAATRKRMSGIVKTMIVNMYANEIARRRPGSSVRSAVRNRGPSLRKRLFGNNK
jgi:hypothetical protein